MNDYQTDKLVIFDTEVYRNFFLCGMLTPDGIVTQFEDRDSLLTALASIKASEYELCGFNSQRYDDPVMSEFLRQGSTLDAYNASVAIISGSVQPWVYEVEHPSVDLMPLLPGRMSLKQIGVRLHHQRLQELPVAFDKDLTSDEKDIIRDYNINDLQITRKLLDEIQPELDLRGDLSRQYSIDLRSKGDAGIAEEVLSKELGDKASLKRAAQRNIADHPLVIVSPPGWWFSLAAPLNTSLRAIIESQSPRFNTPIPLNHAGRLDLPTIENLYLDDKYYAVGAGGLHSVDGPGSYTAGEDEFLVDIDVTSYYPAIMLNNELFPRHIGHSFGAVYQDLVEQRLKAKRSGDKVTADRLKITINGTFGKTSDPYSSLYDPQVTASTTIIGQVSLLVLIAMLADAGFNTVSANTDGITVIGKKERNLQLGLTVSTWENLTGFNMEYTYYESVCYRDVNNYVANVKGSTKQKTKGIFAVKPGVDLRHSLKGNIIAESVKQYVSHGTSISETITNCTDINQFLLSHAATGNFMCSWWGTDIGKLVRFYRSTRKTACVIIKTDAIKGKSANVPQSEDSVPLQDLPEALPEDIDYAWYIREAETLLHLIAPAKRSGMNAMAHALVGEGRCPYIRSKDKKRTKRILKRMDPGTNDFNAMTEADEFGFRGESELDG